MQSQLSEWASSRGYPAGWYPAPAVNRALEHIKTLRDEGAFDNAFFDRSLSWLEGAGVGVEPAEKSVILVAVPRAAHIVTFDYRGESFDLVLPPTYHNYYGLFGEVKRDLEAFLGGGVSLRTVKAPLKALAARTGFTRYGLNNVTYANGLGSYIQLMAFACHLPVQGFSSPDGKEPGVLDECGRCRACQTACPTKAIAGDRFLIHAERCVTWFSEYEGPLPDAFGAAKRPCLFGCMACQEVCPVNRGLLRLERLGVRFSEEETGFLLGESAVPSPTPEIRAKVEALRCNECNLTSGNPNPTFRRNLGAVLRHRAALSAPEGAGQR